MDTLSWLPSHPDMSAALREAKAQTDPRSCLQRLIALAGHKRDFIATERIDRLLTRSREQLGEDAVHLPGLTPLRVALLSSHTVDHLVPAIRVAGLDRRLNLSVHVAPYGLYRQALLGGDRILAEFAPQLILLALDAQAILFDLPLNATEQEADDAVSAYVEDLRFLWRQARERYGAQVVQQTYIPTAPSVFGSFEGLVPASPAALTASLNAAVRKAARAEGVLLLDVAWHLAPKVGVSALVDPVRWHQAKQLISPLFAPLYGDLVARVAGAVAGVSRKCLVLDLDNTLWGGVIGDDGLDGIRLGQGSSEGEAYLALQRYVGLLASRGVILAVCSKNDMDVAETAFKTHPEMALKREDIAAFIANWDDKAGNIRQVARLLNIGSDSLVFLDDNPAERDIVRRELPEVAVPELPDDIAHYPAILADAGYFEAASFTDDDILRVRSYSLNAERQASLDQATDMEGYLKSLDMTLVARPIGPVDIGRATQLLNKSNQFNLTTRRYTEVDMARMAADERAISLGLRLKDRFGDNGLISVILARRDEAWPDGDLLIDSWLMSCRVLARGVEAAVLEVLATAAGRLGARSLIGEYRPTAKNRMVADHYPNLGFRPEKAPDDARDGATFWRFDAGAAVPTHFISLDVQS